MHVILALFSLCCIIPFVFVVIISFSSEESIRTIGYSFWPMEWSTATYAYAFRKLPQIWRSFFNSILITGIGTLLSTLICVLYSYALYRPDFKYRNFFNIFSFFVMLFGGGLVPTYIISKQVLGLSENYAALIVPLLVSPFNMPIAKPGIATIALLNALSYWNDWFQSLLYIRQNKVLQPLQALLMELQNNVEYLNRMMGQMGTAAIMEAQRAPNQTLRMALVVMIVVPIACAYPFFQRYIVSGLTIGSVKG